MDRYLEEYQSFLTRRGLAEGTRAHHRKALAVFDAFLQREFPDAREVTEITRAMLRAFEKHLAATRDGEGRLMSASRRGRYLSAIKGFFAFLAREELIYADPAAVIRLPRERERFISNVLSVEEMDHLLRVASGHTVTGLRDRAILELLYAAGLRAEEVCGVHRGDLDFTERLVYVRKGKGDRERLIPFGESARYWLTRYEEKARARLCAGEHDVFFVDGKGSPLKTHTLLRIVKKWVRVAGIEKRITTHTFRHSCASHMLKGRADIRYVQMQLGHRSIQTTERYLKIEISDLKEVHARTHPLEREDR